MNMATGSTPVKSVVKKFKKISTVEFVVNLSLPTVAILTYSAKNQRNVALQSFCRRCWKVKFPFQRVLILYAKNVLEQWKGVTRRWKFFKS